MSKESTIKFTVTNEGYQTEMPADKTFPEVIRETTEHGQVVWFNSAPKIEVKKEEVQK